MNLLSSINALLLLAGLVILVLNLAYSAFRLARGHLHAGVISVVTTLLACILLAVGLVRMSFPALAGSAPTSPAASSAPSGQGGSSGNVPARLQTAMASGQIPPDQQTAIAQGTIPAFGRGGNGGGSGGGNGGAQTGGAQTGSAGSTSTPEAAGAPGSVATVNPRLQTAIASGRIPPDQQTAIAQGTIPAFGRGGTGGGNGGGANGGGGNGGAPAAGGSSGDGGSEAVTPQAGVPTTPEAASSSGSAATLPARLQTAIASGRIPPEQQTAIAQGTIPSFGRGGGNGGNGGGNGGPSDNAGAAGTQQAGAATPEAVGTQPATGRGSGGGGFTGGNGGGTGGSGSGGGRFANSGGNSAAQSPEAAADTLADKITIIGALVILVSGLFLYFNERRRNGFEAASSPGLLYLGAGFFALVAALLIPGLPGEFTVARASNQVAIVNQGNPNRILPTRVMVQQGAPTVTPTQSPTATGLPTFTAAPDLTPTPLFTQVAYAYNDVTTPSACTITAQTTINLRGDPSVQNQAIGRVFAGSLLRVIGRTADSKWWDVISDEGTNKVEGWVSTDFVTVSPDCNSAPVIGPTPVGTKAAPTVKPSATSAPATTAPTKSASSTPAGPAATCIVMTTTAVSLRPDPSTEHPPVAQVPEGTALTASGKVEGLGWWQVAYTTGGKTVSGWVGSGAVLAAANCSAVSVVTP